VISFTPRPLYPRERTSDTYWIGHWVDPRAVLDVVVKRKIPSPQRESNPRTPILQPVASHYTDRAMVNNNAVISAVSCYWLVLIFMTAVNVSTMKAKLNKKMGIPNLRKRGFI
jgi:hypothetical protein